MARSRLHLLPKGNIQARRTRPKIPPNRISSRSTQAPQKSPLSRTKAHFLKESVKKWLPMDNKTFLFTLVALIYLLIAVLHYFQTGDPSMLTTLLTGVALYAGAREIVKEVKKGRGDSNDEESSRNP